jgi:glutathione synthase/RimK-type ligase-like ATP-grasp enzyme
MKRAALLFGSAGNAHLQALAQELPDAGLEARVMDPRRVLARGGIRVRVASDGTPSAESDLVELDGVRVVWALSHDPLRLAPGVDRAARPFARAAAAASLQSLRRALDVPWMNDPWRAGPANDKLWQLVLARRRGLRVPETLVSNDPAALRAMARRRGSVAVKSPSGSAGLPDVMRVLTQRVRVAELADDDGIRAAPVMAQEYVAKKSEVRATVVGARVHAVEIFSQETSRTRVDWRRYDHRTRYEALRLPRAVERACVQVTRDVGLDYAGIDLVRTPRDEYVFLEVNSEPAWLWIEDLTGLPLSREIARLIAKRAGAARRPGARARLR